MDSQKESPSTPPPASEWSLTSSDALAAGPQSSAEDSEPMRIERRQELERLIRTAPADPQLYLELADGYFHDERYFDAIRVLEKAVSLHQDDPQILWKLEEAQLARILQRVRETRKLVETTGSKEAAEDLERCQIEWGVRRAEICKARLARNPNQPSLAVRLAEAQRDLGKPREAMEACREVLDHPEHGPAAALVTAQCHQSLGAPLDALTFYRAAGMRRSQPAAAAIRLAAMRGAATLATKLGLVASGLRYARIWRELAPDDPNAAATLAHLETLDSPSPPDVQSEEMPNAPGDR